jgi:cytochrome c oxidase cbb3-type subunit 4
VEAYSTLASIFTVLSFLAFVGIVLWAYGAGRARSFEEAANEPFVLPDEVQGGSLRTLTPGPSPVARGADSARPRRDASNGELR